MMRRTGITQFLLFMLCFPITMHAQESLSPKGTEAGPVSQGSLHIDVTNAIAQELPSKVELAPTQDESAPHIVLPVPKGTLETACPAGSYKAYLYVYQDDVPILVDIRTIDVPPNGRATLPVNLVEGTSGPYGLMDFDRDGDLVIDRVELDAGTDPNNPSSVPGLKTLQTESKAFSTEAGWYKGELHAHSKYGGGQESVEELIKRAEKSSLDFLAITDRNTMAACDDSAFKSDKVVLIPALEWGSDDKGVALIYAPGTFPSVSDDFRDGQGVVYRVQSQGGLFAIAHPCFPQMPWQRGYAYVNLIEVWCRGWREIPPVGLNALDAEHKRKDTSGRLVHSMSIAANTTALSANGQATLFWDNELKRGLRASPIAGSLSWGKSTPLGQPVTYVYAKEKSLAGILEGLRRGCTFLTTDPKGPKLYFEADVLSDGKSDIKPGGIIPAGVDATLYVNVLGAKGYKVQILCDGEPVLTKNIDKDDLMVKFKPNIINVSTYRAQVTASMPEKGYSEGFGDLSILAMTAPIYARKLLIVNENTDPTDAWRKLKQSDADPEFAETVDTPSGPMLRVRPQNPGDTGDFAPPSGSEVKTIEPQFRH